MVSIVSLEKLPKCNIPNCNEDAVHDCPTTFGSWAYLCDAHFKTCGRTGGSHLRLMEKKEVKHLEGTPIVNLAYQQDEYSEVTATVTCPACGHTHNIEPDMNGEMKCHACKQAFQCKSMF